MDKLYAPSIIRIPVRVISWSGLGIEDVTMGPGMSSFFNFPSPVQRRHRVHGCGNRRDAYYHRTSR